MKVTVLFDGGTNGDRTEAAGAAVAYDEYGAELARHARYLSGDGCTHHVAEYCGLAQALALARALGATHVHVLGDSELIVRQFNRIYKCRKEHLKPWLRDVRTRAGYFNECIVEELPKAGPQNRRRFGNDEADALATECIKTKKDISRLSPSMTVEVLAARCTLSRLPSRASHSQQRTTSASDTPGATSSGPICRLANQPPNLAGRS